MMGISKFMMFKAMPVDIDRSMWKETKRKHLPLVNTTLTNTVVKT